MKYTFYILLAAVLLGFTACEDQTFDPVLNLGVPPDLSSTVEGVDYVITEETLDSTFATFSWTPADAGVATQINYTLQVDFAGNNFAESINLVPTTTMTSGTVENLPVNNFLQNRGVEAGQIQALEARVKAVVGEEEDGNVLFSDVINFTVAPYIFVRPPAEFYVPGAHQGWDPPSAPAIFSVENDNIYDGYVYFPTAGNAFKLTPERDWDEDFGDTGADGTLDATGSDIVADGDAGLYRINANLDALTYTLTRTEWGIIGAATPGGWDADTDMMYDVDSGIYSITLDMTAGPFKFRANDAWDIDLGGAGTNQNLAYGGADIMLDEAGNYTIELVLNQAIYAYTVTRN